MRIGCYSHVQYTSSKWVQLALGCTVLSSQTVYHRFAADGASFSLNSDDPSVIECDLTGEYDLAATQLGLSTQQLVQSVRAGSPHQLELSENNVQPIAVSNVVHEYSNCTQVL